MIKELEPEDYFNIKVLEGMDHGTLMTCKALMAVIKSGEHTGNFMSSELQECANEIVKLHNKIKYYEMLLNGEI